MRGLKDTPECLDTEDYVKNIEESAQWKVILSDTCTLQHWLADGASVILYLCRAYLTGKFTRAELRDVAKDVWSPASHPGPESSVKTLLSDSNRALRLYTSKLKGEEKSSMTDNQTDSPQSPPNETTLTKEWFLFEYQAQRFYHWLEQIHDRMSLARRSGDIDLLGGFEGPRSIGFELKDLLSSTSDLEPYTTKLCDGAKTWLPYAKSVNAIHLHSSNLGELLGPSVAPCGRPGCGHESAAPQGKNCLMAPFPVLKEGIERFEHTDVCAQLAHGIYWSDISVTFSPCRCQHSKSSGRCKAIIT